MRPHNGLLAIIAVLIGAIVAAGPGGVYEEPLGIIVAGLAIFLFIGGGNALNDYYDYETDKINHPERPLPSDRMKEDEALWLGRGLLLAAVLITALSFNPLALILVAVSAILMVSYETHLKERGLIGNLTIAILSGALFLFGGLVYWDVEGGGGFTATLILGSLAALTTLAREIIKDIEDVEGDTDRETLAHTMGVENATYLAVGLLLAAVFASPIPFMAGLFGQPGEAIYLGLVFVADILLLMAAQRAFEDARLSQKLVKLAMLAAMVAFLAGAIFSK